MQPRENTTGLYISTEAAPRGTQEMNKRHLKLHGTNKKSHILTWAERIFNKDMLTEKQEDMTINISVVNWLKKIN